MTTWHKHKSHLFNIISMHIILWNFLPVFGIFLLPEIYSTPRHISTLSMISPSSLHWIMGYSPAYSIIFNSIPNISKKRKKQAGAELCQGQGKLKLVWLWVDPYSLSITNIFWLCRFGLWIEFWGFAFVALEGLVCNVLFSLEYLVM